MRNTLRSLQQNFQLSYKNKLTTIQQANKTYAETLGRKKNVSNFYTLNRKINRKLKLYAVSDRIKYIKEHNISSCLYDHESFLLLNIGVTQELLFKCASKLACSRNYKLIKSFPSPSGCTIKEGNQKNILPLLFKHYSPAKMLSNQPQNPSTEPPMAQPIRKEYYNSPFSRNLENYREI